MTWCVWILRQVSSPGRGVSNPSMRLWGFTCSRWEFLLLYILASSFRHWLSYFETFAIAVHLHMWEKQPWRCSTQFKTQEMCKGGWTLSFPFSTNSGCLREGTHTIKGRSWNVSSSFCWAWFLVRELKPQVYFLLSNFCNLKRNYSFHMLVIVCLPIFLFGPFPFYFELNIRFRG